MTPHQAAQTYLVRFWRVIKTEPDGVTVMAEIYRREIEAMLTRLDAHAATIKEKEQRIAKLLARIETLRTIECEDFRPPASCLTEFLPEAYCKRCKILARDDEMAKE